jgi:hypothetical protein
MKQDGLHAAGSIRYRALITHARSLAIARSLGFAGCGHNLIVGSRASHPPPSPQAT